MRSRCSWCEGSGLYREYHDKEWGVPLTEDDALFRLLMLEGQQAGLAWITILNKRAHMDEVFANFDRRTLAQTSSTTIAQWLQDSGLIRHKGKLQALVSNAQCALQITDFAAWLWSFAAPRPLAEPRLNTSYIAAGPVTASMVAPSTTTPRLLSSRMLMGVWPGASRSITCSL